MAETSFHSRSEVFLKGSIRHWQPSLLHKPEASGSATPDRFNSGRTQPITDRETLGIKASAAREREKRGVSCFRKHQWFTPINNWNRKQVAQSPSLCVFSSRETRDEQNHTLVSSSPEQLGVIRLFHQTHSDLHETHSCFWSDTRIKERNSYSSLWPL